MVDFVDSRLRELPLAYAVCSRQLQMYCCRCMKKQPSRSVEWPQCGKCERFTYCSYECEIEDRPMHECECERLCRVRDWRKGDGVDSWADGFTDYLTLNHGGDWWLWPDETLRLVNRVDQALVSADEACRAQFDQLEDKSAVIMKRKHSREDFHRFLRLYSVFFGCNERRLDKERLLRLYSAVRVHTMPIRDVDMNVIGLGLYLKLSALQHSCLPSARVVFQGRTAVVIPTRGRTFDLPLKLDSVRISKIDELATLEERRATLRRIYFLDECNCHGCLDVKRNDDMTAFVCQHIRCRGKATRSRNTGRVECIKCGALLDENELKDMVDNANFHLELMERTLCDSGAIIDEKLECCEEVIELAEGIFYRLNVTLIRAWQRAFEFALKHEKRKEATPFGRKYADAQKAVLAGAKYDARLLATYALVGECMQRCGEREEAGELLFNSIDKYMHIYGKDSLALQEIAKTIIQCDLA